DDLPVNHAAFTAIQIAAIRGIYPLGSDLHASPDAPITRAEAAIGLAAYYGEKLDREKAIRAAIDRGWMSTDHRNWFHADLPLLWTDIREAKLPRPLPSIDAADTGPVKRAEFATRLGEP